MSHYTSADFGFILVDGYSLLGTVTELNDDVEAITQEIHALGDGWFKYGFTSVKKGALSQNGYFDAATGQVNDALSEKQGLSRIMVWCAEGNLQGATFVGAQGAVEAKYDRITELGKFHRANAIYNPSGSVERGQVVRPLSTSAVASWSGTGLDRAAKSTLLQIPIATSSVANPTHIVTTVPHGLVTGDVVVIAGHAGSAPDINGEHAVTRISDTEFTVAANVTVGGTGGYFVQADSNNGGAAYLEVRTLVLGGYTNAAILLKHSTDNATWVNLAAFAAVTSAPTAQRVEVAAGTKVNRFLQDAGSFTGAGSSPSITYMLGFARG